MTYNGTYITIKFSTCYAAGCHALHVIAAGSEKYQIPAQED